jgi:hypothetical protein
MRSLAITAQLVAALGIANVWLMRFGKPTSWRGGGARTMREEFEVCGLPLWSLPAIGSLKLMLATLLIAGIWVPQLAKPAAIGLGLLMLGAVAMHMRVSDDFRKSVPAVSMLMLCGLILVG